MGLCIPIVSVEVLPPEFVVSAVETEAEMLSVEQAEVVSESLEVHSSPSHVVVVSAASCDPVASLVLAPVRPPDRWHCLVGSIYPTFVHLRSGVPEVLCMVLAE